MFRNDQCPMCMNSNSSLKGKLNTWKFYLKKKSKTSKKGLRLGVTELLYFRNLRGSNAGKYIQIWAKHGMEAKPKSEPISSIFNATSRYG